LDFVKVREQIANALNQQRDNEVLVARIGVDSSIREERLLDNATFKNLQQLLEDLPL